MTEFSAAQAQLLGEALTDVLVRAGVVRADHGGLTGPELLLAAREFLDDTSEPNDFTSALEKIGLLGRPTTVKKYQASNHGYLRSVIKKLDEAGFTAEADTLVWTIWWREFYAQRLHEEYDRREG